jgi:L-ascorbate metabolism protein UlaG (beta-lactamase superfamily)
LPDHCHPPTLSKLPRDTPVIAPTGARNTLTDLGYTDITYLSAGDDPHTIPVPFASGSVSITAGPGSIVGPPWSKPQLALLFSFESCTAHAPIRVYHETHGMHDDKFLDSIKAPRLDAVISPVKGTKLPPLGNYTIVNGVPELLAAVRRTQPRAVVPFDNSNTPATGLLNMAVTSNGGAKILAEALAGDAGRHMPDDLVIITPVLEEAVMLASANAL